MHNGVLSEEINGNFNDPVRRDEDLDANDLDYDTDVGTQENIKVVVRVRPLMEHEMRSGGADVDDQVLTLEPPDGKSLTVNGAEARHQLRVRFDACFGGESTQEQVYSQIRECTGAVVDGLNATVFAYGQTGTGKTHTMFGPPGHVQELSGSQFGHVGHMSGVIPRSLVDVFSQLHNLSSVEQPGNGSPVISSYAVYVSFVQIYNEQVFDMLRDPSRGKPLEIHEESAGAGGGIYVQGLSEYAVGSFADCLELLRLGEENRAIRETHMNQASSRSHSIFTVLVEQTRPEPGDGQTGVPKERQLRSKFNLVDLAGSEKWDLNQDMVTERVAEMTNINLSLYTLGRCIAALASHSKRQNRSQTAAAAAMGGGDGVAESGFDDLMNSGSGHIPYRDSKLTRLLQDSLGGNAKTRVIATLSPAPEFVDESVSTLRFADRAKQVMVLLRVNEQRTVDPKLVAKLQKEVAHLRSLLKQLTAAQGHGEVTSRGAPSEAAEGRGGGRGGGHAVSVSPVSSPSRKHHHQTKDPNGMSSSLSMEGNAAAAAAALAECQLRLEAVVAENESLKAELLEAQGSGGGLTLPPVSKASPNSKDGDGSGGGLVAARAVARMEGKLEVLRGTNSVLGEALEGVAKTASKFFAFEIEEDELKVALEKWTKKGATAQREQAERDKREKEAEKKEKATARASSKQLNKLEQRTSRVVGRTPTQMPAQRAKEGQTPSTTTMPPVARSRDQGEGTSGGTMPSVFQKSQQEVTSNNSPLFRQSACRPMGSFPSPLSSNRVPRHPISHGAESGPQQSRSAPNTNRSPISTDGGGSASRYISAGEGCVGGLRRSSDQPLDHHHRTPEPPQRRAASESETIRPEPLSHPSVFNGGSAMASGCMSGAPLSSGIGTRNLSGAPTTLGGGGGGKLSFRVRGKPSHQQQQNGNNASHQGSESRAEVRGGRPKIGDARRGGGGGGSVQTVVDEDMEDEAKLAKELAKAKARMKKHKQLQEWLKQKEEREMALLDREEEAEAERQALLEKKERQRQQRAKKEKKRLQDFYAKLHADAEEGGGGARASVDSMRSESREGNRSSRDLALVRTQNGPPTPSNLARASATGEDFDTDDEEAADAYDDDEPGNDSGIRSGTNMRGGRGAERHAAARSSKASLGGGASTLASSSQVDMYGDDGLAPYGGDNAGEYDDFIGDPSLLSAEGGYDDDDDNDADDGKYEGTVDDVNGEGGESLGSSVTGRGHF